MKVGLEKIGSFGALIAAAACPKLALMAVWDR